MRTLTQKRKMKWVVSLTAMIALTLGLTGCPGDDGGNRIGAPIHGSVHTCQGVCPQNVDSLIRKGFGNDIMNGVMRSQLTLDILGDDVYGDGAYVGAIYLAGSYWVEHPNFVGCPIPRGRYNIETQQAGSMDAQGFFGNVFVAARGVEGEATGHTIFMRVDKLSTNAFQRTKYNITGLAYEFGIMGDVTILSVDGYNCPYTSLFLSFQIN